MVGALCSISHAEGDVPLRALCRIVHATSILVRDLILAGNVCEVCAAHALVWIADVGHCPSLCECL